MTQVLLARKLGVSQPLVSQWERGKLRPGMDDFIRLAQTLGVDDRLWPVWMRSEG